MAKWYVLTVNDRKYLKALRVTPYETAPKQTCQSDGCEAETDHADKGEKP